MIGSLLSAWGFRVVECADGASAWEAIERSTGPLLVVLDWMMPNMNGLELCQKIRDLGQIRSGYVYTVMLTGKNEREDVVAAMEAGVDDFLTKPFDAQDLSLAIRTGRRILDAAVKQHELTQELHNKNLILESLYEELDLKVKERTAALEESRSKAESASRLKSEFLANMSHEIRTPLNGILSYAELLLESELSDEQRGDVKVIKSSAHTLKQIINDILDLSKVEAGRIFISPSPFNLDSLLSETVDVVQLLAEEKNIELVVHCEPNVPKELIGDRMRIQQVLTNLIGNAIKFCLDQGGVIVWVTGEHVGEGFTLEVSISDSGIGIPEERQKAIFEAFEQADGSTTRRYGGTGLGLTICRKLLDLMDGTITLVSKVGTGTTFRFTIPCQLPAETTIGSQLPAASSDETCPKLPALSILLADDHVTNRDALTRLLTNQGHGVKTAGTGQEVLELLKEQEFDVILMDVQMPVMGGDEATIRIRSSGSSWHAVPIIALTANAFDAERTRLLGLGMNGFVSKPVNQKELVLTIAKCLQKNPRDAFH
jgi:signal transduction histidine kinase